MVLGFFAHLVKQKSFQNWFSLLLLLYLIIVSAETQEKSLIHKNSKVIKFLMFKRAIHMPEDMNVYALLGCDLN